MRHKNNNVELGYKCLVLNYRSAEYDLSKGFLYHTEDENFE
jgi:hypothetical protein